MSSANLVRLGYINESSYGVTPAGVASSKEIQDLTYSAKKIGSPGDLISITYEDSQDPVAASRVIQDLTFTAQTAGAAGNSITLIYIDDGSAGGETIGVV